ncbi:Uncharacterized protein YrzB, UPF0473 family [Seinonella peptonophila]|uniref:UPF0473 protein SAMN05444392_103112 n=1 Tax=Seinonella peptonophila TaxID=112248 RepID=A0A1M4W9P3_9BACL|nr:DUF1292 domain-containing protein [Seinonella peptonophila]SHE77927.1 Uncharacterized protein YrzB, UPF0473 family [Seinonella peptonophila]
MTEQEHVEEYLFIPNDDGTEEKFEILYEFERDDTGQKYMLVLPVNEDNNEPEEQEVFAFRYSGDRDNMVIELIEDDEEWNMVQETFQTLVSDEFQEEVYGSEDK